MQSCSWASLTGGAPAEKAVCVWASWFSWKGIQISLTCLHWKPLLKEHKCPPLGCPHLESMPPTSLQMEPLRHLGLFLPCLPTLGSGVGRAHFSYCRETFLQTPTFRVILPAKPGSFSTCWGQAHPSPRELSPGSALGSIETALNICNMWPSGGNASLFPVGAPRLQGDFLSPTLPPSLGFRAVVIKARRE